MALLLLGELVAHVGDGSANPLFDEPMYWVFPLQTVVCLGLLIRWWREYDFAWRRGWGWGVIVGVVALGVWISPQELFHAERRLGGFDLWHFGGGAAFQWNAAFRILRLVVVVPLLEELFWRGFLMRHLARDPFDEVPVGHRAVGPFIWVALFFGFAHWGPGAWPPGPDFLPAVITGLLYNGLACATRSLGACVIAHATTNALLGVYIFRTQQWGFW